MKTTEYLGESIIKDEIAGEWHQCPECDGVFGIDSTYVDQISEAVNCPMCKHKVAITSPTVTCIPADDVYDIMHKVVGWYLEGDLHLFFDELIEWCHQWGINIDMDDFC
jgi:hypothetical protein